MHSEYQTKDLDQMEEMDLWDGTETAEEYFAEYIPTEEDYLLLAEEFNDFSEQDRIEELEKELTELKARNYQFRVDETLQTKELALAKRKIQDAEEKAKEYFLRWSESQNQLHALKAEYSVVPGWVQQCFYIFDRLMMRL